MYITLQEVREQAGFQRKERAESLGDGDGSTVNFIVSNVPIVDRTHSGTPATVNDITVYVSGDEVTVDSATPSSGLLTLASAPASGSPITVDYDWSNIGDSTLEIYGNEAHSLVLSKIGKIYTLPLSEVPSIVKLIEKKLAAGLLLDKEYSIGGDETEDTRGRRWIKWAEQALADIVSGNIELLDSNNTVLSQKSGRTLGGWPDDTTKDADDSDSGGGINFRVSDKF